MTSCSQNRHATKLRYISNLKEVGFEPTKGKNPTDLQSATLNHSVIPPFLVKKIYFFDFFLRFFPRFNFLGRQPLWGFKSSTLINVIKNFSSSLESTYL